MCKTPQAKPKSGACPPKLHPFSAESGVKNKKISSWWRKQDEITEFIHDNEVMYNVIFDNKQFRYDRVWVKFAENIGVPTGGIYCFCVSVDLATAFFRADNIRPYDVDPPIRV